MKIGLTISDYYKAYIEEIAKTNAMSPTTICGIILENWFQFNKNNNRYPIIRKQFVIKMAKKHSDKPEPQPEKTKLEEEQYVNVNIDEPNDEIEYDPNDPYTWKGED